MLSCSHGLLLCLLACIAWIDDDMMTQRAGEPVAGGSHTLLLHVLLFLDAFMDACICVVCRGTAVCHSVFEEMHAKRALVSLACLAAVAAGETNVLLVVVDNLRPSLSSYTNHEALTPEIDALYNSGNATLFSNAFCQIAWCAPSRNSFLTGRDPSQTLAFNFRDSFREAGIGNNWTTLPEYFKKAGYYTTSVGKIFHPGLPKDFDYPRSWSDEPFFPIKPSCPKNTMSCRLESERDSVDFLTLQEAERRLRSFNMTRRGTVGTDQEHIFMAVGFQSPRLPWLFPGRIADKYYPSPMKLPLAKNLEANSKSSLEWFRPTEIDLYSDIRNVTRRRRMKTGTQHRQRQAYFSTITHVDEMVGRLFQVLRELGLWENTNIVVMADHGQNLGEFNMWSMMNLLETSLQVPLLIRPAPIAHVVTNHVYSHPVELVDVFPTLVSLAAVKRGGKRPVGPGLGIDISQALKSNQIVLKKYSFSQITRCRNCTLAYNGTAAPKECTHDRTADALMFSVPCAMTPRSQIDVMGYSVKTSDGWRYTIFCQWNGNTLRGDFNRCMLPELYNLNRSSSAPFFMPEEGEAENLAPGVEYRKVQEHLLAELRAHFK